MGSIVDDLDAHSMIVPFGLTRDPDHWRSFPPFLHRVVANHDQLDYNSSKHLWIALDPDLGIATIELRLATDVLIFCPVPNPLQQVGQPNCSDDGQWEPGSIVQSLAKSDDSPLDLFAGRAGLAPHMVLDIAFEESYLPVNVFQWRASEVPHPPHDSPPACEFLFLDLILELGVLTHARRAPRDRVPPMANGTGPR